MGRGTLIESIVGSIGHHITVVKPSLSEMVFYQTGGVKSSRPERRKINPILLICGTAVKVKFDLHAAHHYPLRRAADFKLT